MTEFNDDNRNMSVGLYGSHQDISGAGPGYHVIEPEPPPGALTTLADLNTSTEQGDPYQDYEYEYDPSLAAVPLEQILPVGLVYGLTLVFGVLGNSLVVLSIARHRKMQTVTNTFLISLASADLLLVTLCVPIKWLGADGDDDYGVDFDIPSGEMAPGYRLVDGANGSKGNRSGDSLDPYEHYEYHIDTSLAAVPLEEIIPVAIVYGLTLGLGVVGNVLVILSIARNRRMQTVTNTFLTSLASADLLLITLCVPIKFAKFFTFSWTFGMPLCKIVHYMQNVSVICSILTMTGMSMERYYAIVHPMKAKFLCTVRRAQRVIVLIWALSFTLATPILIGMIHREVGERRKAYWCIKEWSRPLYSQLYEVGMLLLIFVVPLIILSVAYISICCTLNHMAIFRAKMRTRDGTGRVLPPLGQRNGFRSTKALLTAARKTPTLKAAVEEKKTSKQVIKMLVTIILVFALCWGPQLIDNVLVSFHVVDRYHVGYLRYLRQVFSLMGYFNSCVNPIVYAFMSKNFRESFHQSLCCCFGRRARRLARESSFGGRTSTLSMSRGTSIRYELEVCPTDTKIALKRKLLVDSADEHQGSDLESETGV